MSRRELRKIILQSLYRDEFHSKLKKGEGSDRPARLLPQEAWLDANSQVFIEGILKGVAKHKADIDKKIKAQAVGWSIERISLVDLNIMRLAVYEMLFSNETPERSALNEALELAKSFGEEKSVSFINGILDQILKSKTA